MWEKLLNLVRPLLDPVGAHIQLTKVRDTRLTLASTCEPVDAYSVPHITRNAAVSVRYDV